METVLAIGIGTLITAITQFCKKKFGWDAEKVVIVLVLAVGIAYQAYQVLLPPELQGKVAAFVLGALGTSQITYNFLKTLKNA